MPVHEVFPTELYGASQASRLRSEEAFDALPEWMRVPHGEIPVAPVENVPLEWRVLPMAPKRKDRHGH